MNFFVSKMTDLLCLCDCPIIDARLLFDSLIPPMHSFIHPLPDIPAGVTGSSRAMHLLKTAKLLHENPYTGDRITKASIVHLEPSLLRDTLKSQQQQQAHDNNTNEDDVLSALGLTHDSSDESANGAAEMRQRSPELVAIKFLSSSTSYADGFDSSSDDDESDDEDEGDGGDTTLRQRPLAHGWTAIGQNDIPQKVKFGLKAKREIAALRAAQGHPNVTIFRICVYPPWVGFYHGTILVF